MTVQSVIAALAATDSELVGQSVQPSNATAVVPSDASSGEPNLFAAQTHVPVAATVPLAALVVAQSGTQSVMVSEPAAEVPPKGHAVGTSLVPALAGEPPALYLFDGEIEITPKGVDVAKAEM